MTHHLKIQLPLNKTFSINQRYLRRERIRLIHRETTCPGHTTNDGVNPRDSQCITFAQIGMGREKRTFAFSTDGLKKPWPGKLENLTWTLSFPEQPQCLISNMGITVTVPEN